jgi:hypothetical protein
MNFKRFKIAVQTRFAEMSKDVVLFYTNTDKEELWRTYLNSFPEGSNPIFRERTDHDCNCCKQFIRAIGNVVSIVDGRMVSIWDVDMPDEPIYQLVADALSVYVKSKPIANIFLHYEKTVGTDKNFEALLDGGARGWEHFYVNLPKAFVEKKDRIDAVRGNFKTEHDMLYSGLTTITMDALNTIRELIAQNSLYRGAEFKGLVDSFTMAKTYFDSFNDNRNFTWHLATTLQPAIRRFKNSVIGTLAMDLSDGADLDAAVARYESKVAPMNYKRPTALVTPKMVEAAKDKIAELGLTSSLQRRRATLTNIAVNNLLFVDRSSALSKSVFDEIPQKFDLKRTEAVSISTFINDILPTATSVEVLMDDNHKGNHVSLITAVDPTAPLLFKWTNPFSWSYAGGVTDAIKERVKAAGGNIDGEVCCRLAWYNCDDLDLHMYCPNNDHIYFGLKRGRAGELDVDMNAGVCRTEEPVENIVFPRIDRMAKGVYRLVVNQFSQREKENSGFTVQIDIKGDVTEIEYPQSKGTGYDVEVATLHYDGNNIVVKSSLPVTQSTKAQIYKKVRAIMRSPNHWEGQVGNEHFIFALEDFTVDNPRGIYNEFLKAELNEHRKVLELVGSKINVLDSESGDGICGLGFSSTQRQSLVVKVTGAFTRNVKIEF